MYKVYLAIFLFFYTSIVFTQSLTIKFFDAKTNESLVGVSVIVGEAGFISDVDGKISIENPSFPFNLTAQYLGYEDITFLVVDYKAEGYKIFLRYKDTALDAVVVTGSRYEQNIAKSNISIEVVQADLLRSTNTRSADAVLNKVPGVQILDGQANIRGGSGYSYGAGSRVMMLIDDIPALVPDAGFPNWNDIPIENLSQIEILKGAASALYGSAALNGIINFRSTYATSTPETRFSAAMMVYDKHRDTINRWWGDTLRYQTNFTFSHKQKFKKFDLILGGFYTDQKGFNQFTDDKRGRGNLNVRYRITERWILQLAGMYNQGSSNSYFIWGGNRELNNVTYSYAQPFPGTVSDRMSKRLYIDPSITYLAKDGTRHKLLHRTMYISNINNTDQSNFSTNHYTEYQLQKQIKPWGLNVASGAVFSKNFVDSQILGDTTYVGQNHAGYLQLEKVINNKLSISGGIRYEYIQQNSPEFFGKDTIPNGVVKDDKWIGRLAFNYQPLPFTFLRGSIGQGYRFPTLTERFVTTTFSIFSIFANPRLRPETGWTSELGIKQGFALGSMKGFIDAAYFVSEYKDMIEFNFQGFPNLGFKPLNVGNTRIPGFEIGTTLLINAGNELSFNLFGGYTYINPTYKNFENLIKSVSEDSVNVLKYRSRHIFKMDVETKYKMVRLGVSCQYTSHMINIDKAFEDPLGVGFDVFNIGMYRDINNKGFVLWDTRLIFDFKKITLSFLVNNLLNTEYTLRPALLEAPRHFGLRLDYKL